MWWTTRIATTAWTKLPWHYFRKSLVLLPSHRNSIEINNLTSAALYKSISYNPGKLHEMYANPVFIDDIPDGMSITQSCEKGTVVMLSTQYFYPGQVLLRTIDTGH
jgi:hypothetical protein